MEGIKIDATATGLLSMVSLKQMTLEKADFKPPNQRILSISCRKPGSAANC